ncbi:methyltransferase domain-containing protein [Siculibacillus lacustris]|uniref:Methyltransferase domain-containing protein n=1 Tax=Siculibacillus lacustris TaxID=1549641 RepID=A0A4Q9VHH3_9HYPH|nr:class I SAM-dependent methyltransferase [Siculibacillus lacustris]TBW34597.1 methyltransferase domain-containing protein [Siculibacillus lacustris]
MPAAWPSSLPLICPRCRGRIDGVAASARLEPHPIGFVCPACGTGHPVIDGVALVLPDLSSWMREEHPAVLCRADLPPDLLARIVDDAGGVLARDRALLSAYGDGGDDAVRAWARPRLPGPGAAILDLGCGVGWTDRPDIVGLDLNFALLRRHAGPAVLADALDPPFAAESFDAVLMLDLVDSCRLPLGALAQATALLRPGGTLLLTCAFAWRDDITPRADRLGEDDLDRVLAGGGPDSWLRYAVIDEDEFDWTLQSGPRQRCVYRVRAISARRLGPVDVDFRGELTQAFH